MKIVGSLICVVAILLMFGQILGQRPETMDHKIQDWALIGVFLAIGIPLSQGKKKPDERKKR